MRIEIIGVDHRNGARIEVTSEVGRFWAVWSGPAPEVGASFEAEVSLDESLTWGRSIAVIPNAPQSVTLGEDGRLILIATLELRDEDGFIGLRFGKGLLMLEADGDPPSVGVTVGIDLTTDVTLSDTGI